MVKNHTILRWATKIDFPSSTSKVGTPAERMEIIINFSRYRETIPNILVRRGGEHKNKHYRICRNQLNNFKN